MTEIPTDPQSLRADIEKTRADLGDTASALAAKADVKARAKNSAGHAVDQVKARVDKVTGQAEHALGQDRDRVSSGATSVRESVGDVDVAQTVRKPLPLGLIAGVTALVVAVLIWRRNR